MCAACSGDAATTGDATTSTSTTTAAVTTSEQPPTGSGGPSTTTTTTTTGEDATAATTAGEPTTGESTETTSEPSGSSAAGSTSSTSEVLPSGSSSSGSSGSSTGSQPFCGDGEVDPGEACDDGNMVDDDGCSNACAPPIVQATQIFATSANGSPGFFLYDIKADTWSIRADPPTVTFSQLTNDGERVYMLGDDNVIYQYDPPSDLWSVSPTPGPGPELAVEAIGYFKWTDQGFYYLKDAAPTLFHFADDAWGTTVLPAPGASAGTWDPVEGVIYVRTWKQRGFQVIRTLDDSLVRTIADPVVVDENSRTGSLAGGSFYSREFAGTLQRYDAVSGVRTDTGVTPISAHTSSDVDRASGSIYLGGYDIHGTVFQRYDPVDNQLVDLAASPDLADHSTLTVMLTP